MKLTLIILIRKKIKKIRGSHKIRQHKYDDEDVKEGIWQTKLNY